MDLDKLRQTLAEFETKYWDAPADEAGKTRHIALHIMKLAGKLGTIVERREHGLEPGLEQLKNEVIPDLLYYALSLSLAHDVELEKAFLKRLEGDKHRVTDWQVKRDG